MLHPGRRSQAGLRVTRPCGWPRSPCPDDPREGGRYRPATSADLDPPGGSASGHGRPGRRALVASIHPPRRLAGRVLDEQRRGRAGPGRKAPDWDELEDIDVDTVRHAEGTRARDPAERPVRRLDRGAGVASIAVQAAVSHHRRSAARATRHDRGSDGRPSGAPGARRRSPRHVARSSYRERNASRAREIAVGVRAVVAVFKIVRCEDVEVRARAFSQHPRWPSTVGKVNHAGSVHSGTHGERFRLACSHDCPSVRCAAPRARAIGSASRRVQRWRDRMPTTDAPPCWPALPRSW